MKTKLIISFVLLLITADNHLTNSQWQQTSLTAGNIRALTANGNIIFAGSNDVYKSADNGLNWTATSLNIVITAFASAGGTIYAGTQSTGIRRSTDNGTNWLVVQGISALGISSLGVSEIYLIAGTGSGSGIGMTSNNGINWIIPSITPGQNPVIVTDANHIFVASFSGTVYHSTNNGLNWTSSSTGSGNIRSLAKSGNTLYAGKDNIGVYISTDNGASWNLSSLTDPTVKSFAVTGNNILAGTESTGIYFSSNSGTSWVQKNEGLPLPNVPVNSLLINGDYIYAGTNGSGVFKRLLSDLVAVNIIFSEIPKEYNLFQNYPNPFNPKTNFEFLIADFGFVRLTIYDISGREVEILVNETMKPGIYKASWDASNKPSGIYFYKIIAGEYSETKKMILIK